MNKKRITITIILIGFVALAGTVSANYYQHRSISVFASEGEWHMVVPGKGDVVVERDHIGVGGGPCTFTVESESGTFEFRGYCESVESQAVPDRAERPDSVGLPLVAKGDGAR